MLLLGFYFLLHPGEYAKPSKGQWGLSRAIALPWSGKGWQLTDNNHVPTDNNYILAVNVD
jgi:hypothetical protein